MPTFLSRAVLLQQFLICVTTAAPGLAAGVEIETFILPAGFFGPHEQRLSDSGGIVWRGAHDCAITCPEGVWRVGGPSGYSPLAVQGDPAPGYGPGFELGEFRTGFNMVWNGKELAVPFDLLDTNAASAVRALWVGPPGALEKVVLQYEAVPDPSLPGVSFDWLPEHIRMNRAGELCFGSRMAGAGITTANDDAIWCGTPGNLEIRLREGEPAPGRPAETIIGLEEGLPSNNTVIGPFALSDTGQILITARTESGLGLWLVGKAETTLLAFEGAEAPGSGMTYLDLQANRASFSGGGDVGFRATLETDGGWVRAVLMGFPSSPRIVAMSGDPAPARPGGDPRGGCYKYPNFLAANAWGETLFSSELIDHPTSTHGLYVELGPAGGVVPILLQGEEAPGTDPGVTFSGIVDVAFFANSRQVAFQMKLGGTATSSSDDSIWVWDPDQGLLLVAREGRTLEVGPGDERTVSGMALLSGQQIVGTGATTARDGWRQSLNELGQLLLYAGFNDGSRALVEARVVPSTVVFDDGFESGDAITWSSSL